MIVSDVVPVKLPSDARVIDPPDGVFQVIALRVEEFATFDVPAAPGSPVCSWMNGVATAVAAVLL